MNPQPAPIVAFSTLACPEWDAATVVERAVRYGYDGIEWRGGAEGTVRPSWSAARRRTLRSTSDRLGLASVAVTSYPNLISGDPLERERSRTTIREHVELAADLGAPTVRVFIGVRDDDASPEELTDRAIDGLSRALEDARGTLVGLAIEPHDDHVRSASIRPILDALPDRALGVVWDVANAWSAGEDPDEGLTAYAGRIRYVQVKDGVGRGAAWRLCRLGDGEVPLSRALDAVAARERAVPPISLEWERAWHPDLAPPDDALPAARAWLDDHLAGLPTTAGDDPAADRSEAASSSRPRP